MDELRLLLATDHRQTLEFFFVHLRDVVETRVDRQELLYNASVLAHYAQVSTCATGEMPTPSTLAGVFDHYVMDQSLAADPEMMEAAGAQCLLLAGFFEDQMRILRQVIDATAQEAVATKKGRKYFIRCRVSKHDGKFAVTTTGEQGSRILMSMVKANGLMIVSEEQEGVSAGERVAVQILDQEFGYSQKPGY